MADEDRLARVELRQEHGQDVERLLVEEAPACAGARGGSELPWPKREKATTRRPVASLQRLREAAPQPDRAEPLVQEHERAASPSPGRSATSTASPSTVAMARA